MSAKPKDADVTTLRKNEQKWSKSLMDAGWNAMPSIIIEKQEALGLDAVEMNIILHLSNYWWTADNLPHPSVEKIGKAIGLKPRATQKRIAKLVAAGFLTRQERRHTKTGSSTNLYGFEGLIEKVRPFAEEKNAKLAANREEEQKRLARKKPKLTVVPSS